MIKLKCSVKDATVLQILLFSTLKHSFPLINTYFYFLSLCLKPCELMSGYNKLKYFVSKILIVLHNKKVSPIRGQIHVNCQCKTSFMNTFLFVFK